MPVNSENAATVACLTFEELVVELQSRCDSLVMAYLIDERGQQMMGGKIAGRLADRRGLVELLLKGCDEEYREWLEDSDNNLDRDSEGAQD